MTQATITMIDYGASNIRSAQKAFEHVGAKVILTEDPEVVQQAQKLVLPGVGAFGAGMEGLRQRYLPEAIHESVRRGVPFLGICVGMQLMFTEGQEMGVHKGLNLLAGVVKRFPDELSMVNGQRLMANADEPPIANRQSPILNLKVPHMGWNQLVPAWENPLLAGIKDGDYTYFVHSYYCDLEDATAVLAWTDYGFPFASVVAKDNLFGLQFHPEKSQQVGLRIIRNFIEME